MKNYLLLIALFALLSCQQSSESIKTIFSFPNTLKEISGISYDEASNLYWTLEDSGNENAIYALNSEGAIVKTVKLADTKNVDWEDITKDKEGNLYIGDFGNNENKRRDLCIYKMDKASLNNGTISPAYKVSFAYPEQKEFPPKKKDLLFDVESFFEFNNYFYLFTKNRSKGFDGTSYLYKVPNIAGFHEAKFLGEFKTCGDFNHCAITSACISKDQTKAVVLTHDKIWLFENFKGDDFLGGKITKLALNNYTQKEGICFKDNTTLIIADEKTKKLGGNVYEVDINELKAKP